MTTKRRGRSRKARRPSLKGWAARTGANAAGAVGSAMREALGPKVVRNHASEEWQANEAADRSAVKWQARYTAEDKELYAANFDGLEIEFEMWPEEHTDLETAARDAAQDVHGPIAVSWTLYSIHAVNDAAKAVLPYPI